jgi:hypothetical protein
MLRCADNSIIQDDEIVLHFLSFLESFDRDWVFDLLHTLQFTVFRMLSDRTFIMTSPTKHHTMALMTRRKNLGRSDHFERYMCVVS